MAKQIEGVYEAILDCAKREFLEKGYKDASLRTIAREANTSTGSIYTRFQDKEGLFKAVVEPAVQEMRRMFLQIQERFHSFDEQTQRDEMGRYTARHQMEMLDYIYDHFDEFRLLLSGAHIYTYDHDGINAGGDFVCLHACSDGVKRVWFPAISRAFDERTGERIPGTELWCELRMKKGESRLLRLEKP